MIAGSMRHINQNSPISDFRGVVIEAIDHFAGNQLFQKLDSKKFDLGLYHKYLKMIFHQTFNGPSTFALAAANCNSKYDKIRDYLIHHADEEKSHWEWVQEDLESTGYKAADPRNEFPPIACQSYLAFNYFLAMKFPIARLGAAATLEGIGAKYGKKSATELMSQLKLRPNQLKFIFGHGDTDVGHVEDIYKLLESSKLEPDDWAQLQNAAYVSSRLYRAMYDEVASSTQ